MKKCSTNDCENPVMVVYHWPGQVGDQHACLICAMGWEQCGQAMGWPFDGRPMTHDELMEAWKPDALEGET